MCLAGFAYPNNPKLGNLGAGVALSALLKICRLLKEQRRNNLLNRFQFVFIAKHLMMMMLRMMVIKEQRADVHGRMIRATINPINYLSYYRPDDFHRQWWWRYCKHNSIFFETSSNHEITNFYLLRSWKNMWSEASKKLYSDLFLKVI